MENTMKRLALSFDDGPNPATTPQVLTTLAEREVKSTFFMIGELVSENPDLAKQVAKAGHDLGNHTWNHPHLTDISLIDADSQLTRTHRVILENTGQVPTMMRPPFGDLSPELEEIIPYPIILWALDSEDWLSQDTAAILSRVLSHLPEDGIILLHDAQPATAAALPELIDGIRGQGFEIVPVSELLGQSAKPGKVFKSVHA
jgi:peptidoglycan/xylan/chitin deacetylase (PgdA/CDA1 family)